MSVTNITRSLAGERVQRLLIRSAVGAGFSLTMVDRLGIERLLRHGATQHVPNPDLLSGLLRHKLRTSLGAAEPASRRLVGGGFHLTYMIGGDRTRSGSP